MKLKVFIVIKILDRFGLVITSKIIHVFITRLSHRMYVGVKKKMFCDS